MLEAVLHLLHGSVLLIAIGTPAKGASYASGASVTILLRKIARNRNPLPTPCDYAQSLTAELEPDKCVCLFLGYI